MPTGKLHIVFAERYDAFAVEHMRRLGRVTVLESCDEPTLVAAVADADALLVRTAAKVTRAVIEAGRRLQVIGRAGVGLENIDLEAAQTRRVAVVYTPEAATEAVADLTLGLLLSLERRIAWSDALVRAGQFTTAREQSLDRELSTLRIGIVGMGRIGKAVARRCHHGFGMQVLYNDIIDPGTLDIPATAMSKQELFERADVVSLHVPLTEQTRNLIDSNALGAFKPGSMLINTARGAIVDHFALARALIEGHLRGAGLDVTEPEPLPIGHPLLSAPRVLFTPHVGARTYAGQRRMNLVVEDVQAVLQGRAPKYPAWTLAS